MSPYTFGVVLGSSINQAKEFPKRKELFPALKVHLKADENNYYPFFIGHKKEMCLYPIYKGEEKIFNCSLPYLWYRNKRSTDRLYWIVEN